jgi:hypothetical protein
MRKTSVPGSDTVNASCTMITVAHIVSEGIDAGLFQPIDSKKMARMLYVTVMGAFLTFFSVDPDFTFSDQLAFQIDFMLKAL